MTRDRCVHGENLPFLCAFYNLYKITTHCHVLCYFLHSSNFRVHWPSLHEVEVKIIEILC